MYDQIKKSKCPLNFVQTSQSQKLDCYMKLIINITFLFVIGKGINQKNTCSPKFAKLRKYIT